MGIVSPKLFLTIVAIILGLSFMVGLERGLINLGKDDYACSTGRHWYNEVGKQRWLAIGKLNLYYQPVTYGCESADRYDPSRYRIQNGLLVPADSGTTK